MREPTRIGPNKTGLGVTPRMSNEMLDNQDDEFKPLAQADDDPFPNQTYEEIRQEYFRESDPIGSMPPLTTLKGVAIAGFQKLTRRQPEILLDKLGERLAFERTGVRLYESFIAKCETVMPESEISFLRDIHSEEIRHFEIINDVIKRLGADPTAITPCADVSAVATGGLINVINDPRTSIAQSTLALLIAELTDNDGWDLLIHLTSEAGLSDVTAQFKMAKEVEDRHLIEIRNWWRKLVTENHAVTRYQ